MKKQLAAILAAGLILCFGATNAFAAGRGCHYRDADHDGICDFAGTACAYADEDGDGVCDYCGMNSSDANWHGVHFTDEDKDGICDYYAEGVCPAGDNCPHSGQGYGQGYHRGCRRQGGCHR